MKARRVLFIVASLALAICIGVNPAAADYAISSFTSTSVSSQSPMSLGWSFTTNSAVTVNALGYYDYQQNGLVDQHIVGIFNASGTLLASTPVSSGTVDPLNGSYRYASITPITLAAGQTFTIAATTVGYSDYWLFGTNSQFTVNSAISLIAGQYVYGGGSLQDPANHNFGWFYAPANFRIAPTSSVPLPPSLLLLAPGLFGLVGMRRKFQK